MLTVMRTVHTWLTHVADLKSRQSSVIPSTMLSLQRCLFQPLACRSGALHRPKPWSHKACNPLVIRTPFSVHAISQELSSTGNLYLNFLPAPTPPI